MSKPWIHAKNSARRWGGKPEDYIEIHNLMDSSKSTISDMRHRVLTHNSWFIGTDGPLERIFGINIINSDEKEVSVRDIGEQHILEDFGGKFIPSAQDYIQEMEIKDWMQNGSGEPPDSVKKIYKKPVKGLSSWKDIVLDDSRKLDDNIPFSFSRIASSD